MKENILITGGTGFLGKKLTSVLKEKTEANIYSLSSRDLDLRYYESFKQFSKIKFSKIYHLAAWTQAGDFSLYHPGEEWIFNQLINSNILFWWLNSQRQAKFISIGTSCSYEEGSNLIEKDYLKGEPLKSLYEYGMTKRMLIIGQQSLFRQFDLEYLTVVPSTLYGPGYDISNKIPHFIFDIIKKIIRGKNFGEKVELWGNGEQKRELVHINDFVNQMLLIESKVNNEIINIGAGEEYKINQFAKLICNIVKFDHEKIIYNKDKFVGAKSKKLNIERKKELLPNYKNIPLEEGLRETILDLEKKLLND
jgi:GDP-L-fucose synthase